MGHCSRCGREAETEYGADGQAYCSSCIFYGINKQCWKCRMYLPSSELQQYRGQWICPNCLMDLRDEEKSSDRMTKRYSYSERCQRCGREAERLYVWNGRRLCASCLNEGQSSWDLVGGGPMAGGNRIPVRPLRVSDEPSILGRLISGLLIRLGLKKRPRTEIVALEKVPTPFGKAKTMTEKGIKNEKTQVEGLMKDDDRVETESIMKKKPRKVRHSGKKRRNKRTLDK